MAAQIELLAPAAAPADDAGMRAVLTALDQVDLSRLAVLDAAGLAGFIADADRVLNRVRSYQLKAVAAADRLGVAADAGLLNTGAWFARLTNSNGPTAAGAAHLATALDTTGGRTADAFGRGDLSPEHAKVITGALGELPTDVTPAERVQVEDALLEKAQRLNPGQLRREARRATDVLNRDPRLVDVEQARQLRNEEHAARAKTTLWLHDNTDGTTTGGFTIPTYGAHLLRKMVQSLTAPRRSTSRRSHADDTKGQSALTAGDLLSSLGGHVEHGGRTDQAGRVSQAGRDAKGSPAKTGVGQRVTDWKHEYGLAFLQLLEHLPTDRLHSKTAATVLVTINEQHLRDRVGAAHLDTGLDVSPGLIRRWACEAGILPAVLGGDSVPIDLGRTTRCFTDTQRMALATRYDTCAADGCDRPFAWTETHHLQAWEHHGRTDLDNAIPLCGRHHHLIHHDDYTHAIHTRPAGRKLITFTRRT